MDAKWGRCIDLYNAKLTFIPLSSFGHPCHRSKQGRVFPSLPAITRRSRCPSNCGEKNPRARKTADVSAVVFLFSFSCEGTPTLTSRHRSRMLPHAVLLLMAPLASAYSSKGCYSLSSLQSVLTSKGTYTYQTNSYCEEQCSGFAVAATLDGSTCYCSNDLPSDVESVSSSNCNVACQGFPSEICGGDGYLTVMSNGSEDTSPLGDSNSSSSSTTSSSTTSSSSTSTSAPTTTKSASTTIKSASTTITTSASTTSPSTQKSTGTSSTSSSETSSTSQSVADTTAVSVVTSIITASHGSATTITQTQSSSATASAPSSSGVPSSSAGSSGSGLSKGAIAGIAVGAIVGVLLVFGALLIFFLRRRNSEHEDEDHEQTEKPVHNEMDFYNNAFGSTDAFNTQIPPVPFFAQENGRKRLSNGSLPDARVDNQKTLRVTNPDEFTFTNDSTLYDQEEQSSSDGSEHKFR